MQGVVGAGGKIPPATRLGPETLNGRCGLPPVINGKVAQ